MEDSINHQLDLPPEASHYNLRIGGHTHLQGKLKLGVLKHKNGNILKPFLPDDPRSIRELSFYQNINENFKTDSVLHELQNFVPSFYGTMEATIDGTEVKYLCIEDICGTFQKPCVLDIKVGSITYDPLASKEKIIKEKKKYPSVEIFGFRILGMKVYDHFKQQYTSTNKAFGISLTTAETVSAGLGKFFSNKLGQINFLILSGFFHKLLQLKNWFMKQRKFIFISTSLLFVYEGNFSSWISWINTAKMHTNFSDMCKLSERKSKDSISLHYNDCSPIYLKSSTNTEKNYCNDCYLQKNICNELQNNCPLFRISILDFAHVFPTQEEDFNYTFGLKSLISYWQQMLKTSMESYL